MNATGPWIHPREALFEAAAPRPRLPVCDHYSGVHQRMVKSLHLQAQMAEHPLFDVTLDLEDGAAVGQEAAQASLVAELVMSELNRFGRVGVRVHDAGSPYFLADLTTLLRHCGSRLAYLMVPKVEDLAQAQTIVAQVSELAKQMGMKAPPPIHLLIETHAALHQVYAIAALEAVQSLSFGLMDFVSAHRGAIPAQAMSASGQFEHPLVLRAKLEIAAACHAHGKTPSHCIVTEFKDPAALAQAAHVASQRLGYTRMWSIHPDQIATIIRAFAPVAEEIQDAGEILLAAREAHWAPISYRNTLHDRASYRHYWQVLERAWSTGQELPQPARRAFFEETTS